MEMLIRKLIKQRKPKIFNRLSVAVFIFHKKEKKASEVCSQKGMKKSATLKEPENFITSF